MQRSGAGVASRSSSSSTTNEILPLEECRTCVVGETTETQVLNPEFVRQIRGNDKLYFRGNYQSGRTTYSQAKLIVPSNWPPRSKAGDTVLENCVFNVGFEARFVPPERLAAERMTTDHCQWMEENANSWDDANCTFVIDSSRKEALMTRAGSTQFFYWCLQGRPTIHTHTQTRMHAHVIGAIRYGADRRLDRHPRWTAAQDDIKHNNDHTMEFVERYKVVLPNSDERKLQPKEWSGIAKTEIYKQFTSWFSGSFSDQRHLMASSEVLWTAFNEKFRIEKQTGEVVLLKVGHSAWLKGIHDPDEHFRWISPEARRY